MNAFPQPGWGHTCGRWGTWQGIVNNVLHYHTILYYDVPRDAGKYAAHTIDNIYDSTLLIETVRYLSSVRRATVLF